MMLLYTTTIKGFRLNNVSYDTLHFIKIHWRFFVFLKLSTDNIQLNWYWELGENLADTVIKLHGNAQIQNFFV